ncbi:MAG: glycosyltransferase [Candidatus Hydrogenedens sp.]|jgi:GT2 family glycosyltransferase|nr:glycosyltransferase [Candidatus Hydrogenedens sp.]
MKPQLSVIIPSFEPDRLLLQKLHDSLCAQEFRDFEIVIADDGSSDMSVYDVFTDERTRILRQEKNQGPAVARNRGALEALASKLFFTDTDCELAPQTLSKVVEVLEQEEIVTGNTHTRVKSALGRAIALLGFPGGGILGFDKVWRVDPAGYARSFSSCNLAMSRKAFDALGGFDETFPLAGGEDTVLAARAVSEGYAIRYVPEVLVYHIEKSSLISFMRWQLVRGRGNWHIKRRVPSVSGYLRLRVWTFTNSMRKAGILYGLPVFVLICLSVLLQLVGMLRESRRMKKEEAS